MSIGLRAAKPQTMPEARMQAVTAKITWPVGGVSTMSLLGLGLCLLRNQEHSFTRTQPSSSRHLIRSHILRQLRRKALIVLQVRRARSSKGIIAQRLPNILPVLDRNTAARAATTASRRRRSPPPAAAVMAAAAAAGIRTSDECPVWR